MLKRTRLLFLSMKPLRLSPLYLFLEILVIVFITEAVVMFLLPSLLPQRAYGAVQALVDSCLLTLLSAPLLWWSIIRPLRELAVTEHAKAEALGVAAPEGIIAFDRRGTITSFNPAAEQIFGFAASEIVGHDVETLIPWRLLAHQQRDVTGESGGPHLLVGRVKILGSRKGGGEVPLALSVSEVRIGAQPLYTAVVRDLVDRERDEMRAEQMAAVAQLGSAFAHRLRNPLTSIKMLVQASSRHQGPLTLDGEDMRIIEDEVRRMERSVQMFLDFARPRKLQCRLIALPPLVAEAIDEVAQRAEQKKVRIQFSCHADTSELNADADQLVQLIQHLLQNAIDATPSEGEIEVELRKTERGDLELRVLDFGPGIPAELLSQLFQPFVTTKATGVGLGLVIARRIAHEHGGSLTASNRTGGGSCFTVRLPGQSAAEVSTPPNPGTMPI